MQIKQENKKKSLSEVVNMPFKDVAYALSQEDNLAAELLGIEIEDCQNLKKNLLHSLSPNKNNIETLQTSTDNPPPGFNSLIPQTQFQQGNNLPQQNTYKKMKQHYSGQNENNNAYFSDFVPMQVQNSMSFPFPGDSMLGRSGYSFTMSPQNNNSFSQPPQDRASILNFLGTSNFSTPNNFFQGNNNSNNSNNLGQHLENIFGFRKFQ